MVQTLPEISIIIATFNRAKFIGTTLDSLSNQTYSNFEVIIVDDGGSDNTGKILTQYLKDNRFSYYKRPNTHLKGCPGSRNFGLNKALGKFVWFFDDDDLVHPRLLEIFFREMQNKNFDFFRFGRTVFYREDSIAFTDEVIFKNRIISKNDLKEIIIGKTPFNSCQVIWRKSSLGSERFREDIIYADDWEFYPRLVSKMRGVSIDLKLLFARKHKNSATYKFQAKDEKIIKSVILANCSNIDLSIREKIMDKKMFKFFYRQALTYKSIEIVNHLLKQGKIGYLSKLEFRVGFYVYPFLTPFFYLKSKIKSL